MLIHVCYVWCKYTQCEYSMKYLCIANNKPSEFCITSQEYSLCVYPHWVAFHFIMAFTALIRDNQYALVQQWASFYSTFLSAHVFCRCFLQISIFLPLYIYRSCMMMSKCKLDRVDILHSFFALRYWMCVVTNTYPMMHCAQLFCTWVPVMWAMCVNQALSVHFPANLKNTYSYYYGW